MADVEIGPLVAGERAAWERLARGYKTFYRTEVDEAGYAETWQRVLDGVEVCGIGATLDGQLVGIAHYLFHQTLWMAESCYLQDLFVAENARGHGVARALIEHVAGQARERKCARLYWTTQQDNATARVLYNKVARFNGFIRYDYPMDGPASR